MLSAVNVPQSKTVSIGFISLKSMVFGIIITVTIQQISEDSSQEQCANPILPFTKVL